MAVSNRSTTPRQQSAEDQADLIDAITLELSHVRALVRVIRGDTQEDSDNVNFIFLVGERLDRIDRIVSRLPYLG